MKKIAIMLFLMLIGFCIWAELKESIAIINIEIHNKTKETFKNIVDYFNKENEPVLANIFSTFANGMQGSGFILENEDGKYYLVTNRHVVNQAEKVAVTFETADRNHETYNHCEVLYVDNELDLALLRIPGMKNAEGKGLTLFTGSLTDGMEIWSAGFPSLMAKPIWQYAKGNITNSFVELPELVDPEITALIQHSAPVDPGNSGSPLLIKTGSGPIPEYQVVGINTWQISSRQNTFFSIPAAVLVDIIRKAEQADQLLQDSAALKADLIKHCKILAAESSSRAPDFSKLRDYISYSFVAEKGWESFLAMLKKYRNDQNEADRWRYSFFNYSPLDTMRIALAEVFRDTLQKNEAATEVEFTGINFADEQNFGKQKVVRTNFTVNGQKREFTWEFQFGHWQISYTDVETGGVKNNQFQPKKSLTDSTGTDNPVKRGLAFSVTAGFGARDAWGSYWDQSEVTKDITEMPFDSLAAGFMLNLPLYKIFSAGLGAFYTRMGRASSNDDWTYTSETWHFDFLMLPLLFKFSFSLSNDTVYSNFFLGAGAAYNILLGTSGSARESTDSINLVADYFDTVQRFNVSMLLNAGINTGAQNLPVQLELNLLYDLHLLPDWVDVHGYPERDVNFSKLAICLGLKYFFQ